MRKFYSIVISLILVSGHAQEIGLHVNLGGVIYAEGESYPSLGLGIEAKASSRLTIFTDFDYGYKPGESHNGVSVTKSLINIQPGIRFYDQAFKGLTMSFFGFYGRETFAQVSNNEILGSDKTGIGIGLGYAGLTSNGLSFKFDPNLGLAFEDAALRFQFRAQIGYAF